jgi:hypothetical protein
MVLEVLERSLSSDKGLDKESEAGEHSQSAKEEGQGLLETLNKYSCNKEHKQRVLVDHI